MANFNMRRPVELSENAKAAKNFIKFVAFVIMIGVVVYSEYLFIGIIGALLPDGVGRVGAILGAVATGLSVLTLVAAKILWVTPGSQEIWAWLFTGVEVVILGLNDMLAYAMHNGTVDQNPILATWQGITPSGPLMALVGWILIWMLDAAQRERHRDMELDAKKARNERQYIEEAHRAEMDLRHNHLNQVVGRLQEVINSPEIQARIIGHAEKMVDRVLTDVSGIAADITALPPAQTPKQIAPASLAQTSNVETSVSEKEPGFIDTLLNALKPKDDDEDSGTAGVAAKK